MLRQERPDIAQRYFKDGLWSPRAASASPRGSQAKQIAWTRFYGAPDKIYRINGCWVVDGVALKGQLFVRKRATLILEMSAGERLSLKFYDC
jgi:hypothetical protein